MTMESRTLVWRSEEKSKSRGPTSIVDGVARYHGDP
jgi:hypothetical protein